MNRPFIWKLGIVSLAAVAAFGCAPVGTETSTGKPDPAGAGTAAPAADAKLAGNLEVQAFKGGFGIDFYEAALAEFGEKHPELKTKIEGDPRVWERLKPRMVAGDTPDLMFPGWGMDHWSLIADNQLMPLDAALDSPADGAEGTWRDQFLPDMLKIGQVDGKTYLLPLYVNLNGWWYDKAVFDKNGWKPPTNFAELKTLCAAVKAKGMAPITYQGKYPYYMIHGMLLPWAYSVGGADAMKAVQNLEPGAWKSDSMLQAAKMIVELRDLGYFQKGATAMSHTESQAEFVIGRAAMIPCGTWLYSEMKDNLTDKNQLTFFLPPPVEGGKGDPSALIVSIEPWMVPAKAKNPEAALAFYKYMTSPAKAAQFVSEKNTLTAIKGSESGIKLDVLRQPAALFAASKDAWAWQVRDWYKPLHTEIENALTSMLNGELTPEQFVERCEKAAEATRNDPNIAKRTL